eukprot:2408144-Amphidinium_carterae.1
MSWNQYLIPSQLCEGLRVFRHIAKSLTLAVYDSRPFANYGDCKLGKMLNSSPCAGWGPGSRAPFNFSLILSAL